MPGSIGTVLIMMHPEFDKNILIFLLSAIGLIVFPHVYHLPMAVFGFFFLVLSWRFICIRKQNWLPQKFVIFFLTALAIFILYIQHQGILGRDAGTSLFVTALGLKLLEIKTERDLYLIIYLAFIVAASQFLYDQSLTMAAYILLVCCVLLATLVCINSRTLQTFPALKTAGIIVMQAIPIAVVIFILFPRIEAPRWMLFNDDHQARMGLSDSMEPGSISSLGLSDELAFRVKFAGAIPPPHERYWRGPVLSHTDGKHWTQLKTRTFGNYINKPVVTGTPYQYTLLMEPQDKHWVFALDMPAEFSLPLRQNANYQLITSENPDKRAEYKVTSYPKYNTGPLTHADYIDATQLPGEPSGKIKQLVKQLHGFDDTPENFIKQLLNHFRKEDFHYTLTPPLMEENPIETFLFETRYGFCSHYAAAFVYLMRAANIPARVVTGYQGGELNRAGNFLEIRQANAHAWTEVWLENQGWVRFDPTAAIAPERIEQDVNLGQLMPNGIISFAPGANVNWLKQARQLWGNIDYNWQRWVINYDSLNQSRFLSSLGIDDIKAMMYWMMALIALITAVLSWFLLHQKQQTIDKAVLIYNRFCKKLAKRGLSRGAGEGAKDFAERIKIKLPNHAKDIDRITAVFIDLRYGKNANPDDLTRFSSLVAEFKV
ncbi:MAG: transglutaminase TgpA family protein [Methylobacter sp.]